MGNRRSGGVALAAAILLFGSIAGCGVSEGDEGLPEDIRESVGVPLAAEASRLDAALAGETLWLRHLRGTSEPFEYGGAVAVDRDKNVVIVVSFTGTMDFGAGPIGVPSAPNVWNLGVAKYRPDGTLLWARAFMARPDAEGRSWAFAGALAVDRQRNIVFAGTQEGSLNFGGSDLEAANFLVKLDASGQHVWSTELPGRGYVADLGTDSQGNLAMTGYFEEELEDGLTFRAFLAKLSPSGRWLWIWFEAPMEEGASSSNELAVDSSDNLIIVGYTSGLAANTPFIRKFSPEGQLLWSDFLEGASGTASGVAVHGNRIVMTGNFFNGFQFGGRTVTPTEGLDAFLVAYTASGEERWARSFGRYAQAVDMDRLDGVVVTGGYESGDDLGTGPVPGVPNSSANLYVSKFNRIDGSLLWVRAFGINAPADDLAVTWDGESVLLGTFFSPFDFGTGTVTPTGANDLYLLELAR